MEHWALFFPGCMFVLPGFVAFLLPYRLRSRLHGRVHKQVDDQVVEWPEADRSMGWAFLLTGIMSINAAITCLLFHLTLRHSWILVIGATMSAAVIGEHLFSGPFPRETRSDR